MLNHARNARILLLALLTAAACSKNPTDGDAALTGTVVARDITAARPWLHVKSSDTDPCGVVLTVGGDTRLQKRAGDKVTGANVGDFTVGSHVRVWIDAVATSCPAQGIPDAIELVQ
jgi:hypothetical protein